MVRRSVLLNFDNARHWQIRTGRVGHSADISSRNRKLRAVVNSFQRKHTRRAILSREVQDKQAVAGSRIRRFDSHLIKFDIGIRRFVDQGFQRVVTVLLTHRIHIHIVVSKIARISLVILVSFISEIDADKFKRSGICAQKFFQRNTFVFQFDLRFIHRERHGQNRLGRSKIRACREYLQIHRFARQDISNPRHRKRTASFIIQLDLPLLRIRSRVQCGEYRRAVCISRRLVLFDDFLDRVSIRFVEVFFQFVQFLERGLHGFVFQLLIDCIENTGELVHKLCLILRRDRLLHLFIRLKFSAQSYIGIYLITIIIWKVPELIAVVIDLLHDLIARIKITARRFLRGCIVDDLSPGLPIQVFMPVFIGIHVIAVRLHLIFFYRRTDRVCPLIYGHIDQPCSRGDRS